RDKANAFFALPLEEKLRAAHSDPTMPRGYRALGLEALSHGNAIATPADLKEYYHIGRERWPDDAYFTSAEGTR
ncbi:2-oxoglutarate and iron-dependent oxygenase domain-containing protein, partial [Casaltella massiliensis]|nr:2-oxoglutarate and iron-dependent oxygenase domain-containing protein [Casaltella massiliensis]